MMAFIVRYLLALCALSVLTGGSHDPGPLAVAAFLLVLVFAPIRARGRR